MRRIGVSKYRTIDYFSGCKHRAKPKMSVTDLNDSATNRKEAGGGTLGEGASPQSDDMLFDLSILNAIDRKDNELIKQLTSVFIDSMNSNLEELKAAFASGDTETLKRIAHKMKPSIDLFGIKALYQVIRDLEGTKKTDVDAATALDTIDRIMQTVIRQLQQYV